MSGTNNTFCIASLSFSNNRIPPEGAIRFAIGLNVNKTIRILKVRQTLRQAWRKLSLMFRERGKRQNKLITKWGVIVVQQYFFSILRLKCYLLNSCWFKMGRNPMQSAGCYGILNSIQSNPASVMEYLDFSVRFLFCYVILWVTCGGDV